MASKELGEDNLNQTEQFGLIGDKLINMYIYTLYSRSLKNIVKTDAHSLSNWKAANEKIVNVFSSSPTKVGIGGNIVQFLTTSDINIIELDLNYGEDAKLHNIIRIEKDARALLLKDNQVVYATPPELPMIVRPKPYSLKDGIISLGGYLGNDLYYTNTLFIPKVAYKIATKLNKKMML